MGAVAEVKIGNARPFAVYSSEYQLGAAGSRAVTIGFSAVSAEEVEDRRVASRTGSGGGRGRDHRPRRRHRASVRRADPEDHLLTRAAVGWQRCLGVAVRDGAMVDGRSHLNFSA